MRTRILAILFFAFILWAIYQANTGAESVFAQFVRTLPYGDKLGHFGLFGVLTLLVNMSFNYSQVDIGRFSIMTGSLLVLVFATVEEASQGFLSTRTMDVYDLGADCLGIGVFSIVSLYLAKRPTRPSSGPIAR